VWRTAAARVATDGGRRLVLYEVAEMASNLKCEVRSAKYEMVGALPDYIQD
jgi:hypothetical protein